MNQESEKERMRRTIEDLSREVATRPSDRTPEGQEAAVDRGIAEGLRRGVEVVKERGEK